jgi:hypothetical protein
MPGMPARTGRQDLLTRVRWDDAAVPGEAVRTAPKTADCACRCGHRCAMVTASTVAERKERS